MPIIPALRNVALRAGCNNCPANTIPSRATKEIPACPCFQLLSDAAALVGMSEKDNREISDFSLYCGTSLNVTFGSQKVWLPVTFCDYLRRVYLEAFKICSVFMEFTARGYYFEKDSKGLLSISSPNDCDLLDPDILDEMAQFLRAVADVSGLQAQFIRLGRDDWSFADVQELIHEYGDRIARECFGFEFLSDFDYPATAERLEGDEIKMRVYQVQLRNFSSWCHGKDRYRADNAHCPQMPFKMAGLRL